MFKSALLEEIDFISHAFLNAMESEGVYDRLPLLRLEQVHGHKVFPCPDTLPSFRPEADGAVTSSSGIYLSLRTADCVPILFASCRDKVIGVAHAGWKGAISGIVENTLAAMTSLGARRDDIFAAIGPCIMPDSYEVKEDFYYACITKDSSSGAYFPADKKHFDLPGYVADKIRQAGVSKVNFCGIDTFKDNTFNSYRREKDNPGRNISYITIK